MSNSVSNELIIVKNLINEGKFEEALQCVSDIEQRENLAIEEIFRTQGYKGFIYVFIGQPEVALNIAEELYNASQEKNTPLYSLDALFIKFYAFVISEEHEKLYKSIKIHENIFKSISREDSITFLEREADLYLMKGILEYTQGNYDPALKYFRISLTLFEQVDTNSQFILGNINTMAYIYREKGELKLALEYSEKALSLIPKEEYFLLKLRKAFVYRNLGFIAHDKGDLNSALEYYKEDLSIQQEINHPTGIRNSYLNIIFALIDKKSFNQARNYLQNMKLISEKYKSEIGYLSYQLANALILKSSSRLRDRVEAEKILKKLIDSAPSIYYFEGNSAIINLCDLYLEEFQISHQMEILDDIHPLIDLLERNAKLQNSYSLLANVMLLKAKLALIQVNMVEARKLLNEAQIIADEHGLHLLAGDISREHDRLLEELRLWESIKKTQTSVAERLKIASVDDVNEIIERMQGRRAIEPLESSEEHPVLVLIFAERNVLLLFYPFSDEWKQDDNLLGSFLSAFSTFNENFFSQGLDRAKFGEDTLLLESIDSFLICYLFKGQTYSAKQKLKFFSEALNNDNHTIEALKRAVSNRKIIDASDNHRIENLIVKSFMTDPELFRTPFKAYQGEEPFVFASYAHVDKLEVYPIIDYLNKMNIKIWYDEGIPVSENWKKSIAVNLEKCSTFLVFITPQIINSEYVRKEISFALKKRKPFFAVYLKETKLPTELEFEIADIQAMMMFLMPKSEFYANLKELLNNSLNN